MHEITFKLIDFFYCIVFLFFSLEVEENRNIIIKKNIKS